MARSVADSLRALKAAALDVARKEVHAAAEGLAREIASDAPHGATGAFAHSVRVAEGKARPDRVKALVGLEETTFQGERFYPPHVEFGTSEMAGRGTVRKTFDENKDKVRDTLGRAIAGGIVDAAGG